MEKKLNKSYYVGNTVLSSANAPLLAQNILDSRAVDVLECSIFLPKLQNDPLETTKSGKKVGDSSRRQRSEKGSKNRKWPFLTTPVPAGAQY